MNMSQEEIEALMGGAEDILSDEATQTAESEQQIDDIKLEDVDEDSSVTNDNDNLDIDSIVANIDGIVEDNNNNNQDENNNYDDILANIDGITDDTSSSSSDNCQDGKKLEAMIDQSQYPLPVKNENKVVSQLNEVADDSEKKASQIFDVLSFILDENDEIKTYNTKMGDFIEKQKELLGPLSSRFPNIAIFKENLDLANKLMETTKELSEKIDGENTKVFEAMELMQFHDINRQKIERVMAVIRKLNDYLNGIFEDDSDKPEVQIAKHISGDSNETVDEEDLESLISQFSAQEG
jgi:hypothetical protein